jgi:hypothetical protein
MYSNNKTSYAKGSLQLKEGDVVAVLGKLDNRIIERKLNGMVFGTLFYFLTEEQVCVIISDNELWIGPRREIASAKDQL